MRRGRHRLKSRSSQERRRIAVLDSYCSREIHDAVYGLAAGPSPWLETINKLSATLFMSPDARRREYEGDFSGYDDQVGAATYAFTGASWGQAKRERANRVYGDAGSGYRVYGEPLEHPNNPCWVSDAWQPNVIDVDGHVVEPDPAPSALEVYRGR